METQGLSHDILRPFQDYFSSYETGQSVGGAKRENPAKNHLAQPQAELGLSHMWPERGSMITMIHIIRKTCPCIEYPLKLHFYIVKLGYAGVYLFFLFLIRNIGCGFSLEPPRRGGF